MLSLDFIHENKDVVKEAIRNKNKNVDVEKLLSLDAERKKIIQSVQNLRQERNLSAKGQVTPEMISAGKKRKEEIKKLEEQLKTVGTSLNKLLYLVPNIPFQEVPIGKDESGNVVVRKWGEPRKFDFTPKDHIELGKILDTIDTDTSSKVSGTRFGYIKGDLAVMEYALVMFVFGLLTNSAELKKIADSVKTGYSAKPFIPVVPPVMIKPEIFTRMARLDETQEEERYYLPKDDVYLIGSAEHTLGPLHMDQTLPASAFPLRYVGFSTAFRREAGSYGKDTKGILRVHQFDKIEMESFTLPEDSKTEQDFIVAIQEQLMRLLDIPYQVMMICTGDMGGPDARQIDIEAWLPGQNKYRETHTSDLMTDYQARRLNTKVQRNNITEYVHMNDATAFAIGRILIAILENYQEKDGLVKIPKVLQPLMGKDTILPKK